MFYFFGEWDDEGYMLIALKAFAHHGGLYTHVFSQYGPFYYEAFSIIFSWLPLTPDSGRMATLVVALLTSLGLGLAIKMFTGNVLAGVATQVGGFILLGSFYSESMHPAIMVCLLLALALVALALVAQGRRSVGVTMLGATVVALVFTQVNAGAFATIATLFAGSALAPPSRGMRLLRPCAAVLFIGTPFLLVGLVNGTIKGSWATVSGLVALAAAAVVVVTWDRGLQGLIHGRDAYQFLLGGGVLGTLVVIIALLSGTQPVDLFHGVFIGPANLPKVFTIPLPLPVWVELWGAACLAAAFWYRRYRNRNAPVGVAVSVAHVLIGLMILYGALDQTVIRAPGSFTFSFTVTLPLLFLAAIPPFGASESERMARVAVVALALLEGLIAFPVAASQTFWAALLIVPTGMLCLHDGVRQLRVATSTERRSRRRLIDGVIAWSGFAVAVCASLAWLGWLGSDFADVWSFESGAYYSHSPVNLPGAGMMRLPLAQAQSLESLSKSIRAKCSTFLTLPGMNSLYFFANEAPPTWFNTNSWFYLLDATQQTQTVDAIRRLDPSRFCVVDSPSNLGFWAQHGLPRSPLLQLITSFEQKNGPSTTFGDYRLFLPRDTSTQVATERHA
jgi:hypothetical protein